MSEVLERPTYRDSSKVVESRGEVPPQAEKIIREDGRGPRASTAGVAGAFLGLARHFSANFE